MSKEEGKEGPIIYFWHEYEADWGFLSHWYAAKFTDDNGQLYKNAEQHMMYHKALHFKDESSAAAILRESNPRKVKALGRKVKNFNTEEWAKVRLEVAVQGNICKFMRGGEQMRNMLETTGNRELVEASKLDSIWGVGFGEEVCRMMVKEKRRDEWGLNLCGKAIMEARDRIRLIEKEKREEGLKRDAIANECIVNAEERIRIAERKRKEDELDVKLS